MLLRLNLIMNTNVGSGEGSEEDLCNAKPPKAAATEAEARYF